MRSEASLDELDIKILSELELDARQSACQLAAKLATSRATVSKRIARMVDTGITTFCCLTDPLSLGFDVRVLCGLRIVPGSETKVLQTLLGYSCVQNVHLGAGLYDMMVYAVFRDHGAEFRWMTVELAGIKDVLSSEEIRMSQIVKNSWGYADSENSVSGEIKRRDLDETEVKLIQALEANPRESIHSLSKRIGSSRQTVARKFQRLLDEDIIRVASMVDPTAIGFSLHVTIFLKMELDRIVPAAHTLACHQRTHHVIIVGGHYNLLAVAAFHDLSEMTHFLFTELGDLPGIIQRDTMVHLGRPKYLLRFMSSMLSSEPTTSIFV